jgi:hypothetical protein
MKGDQGNPGILGMPGIKTFLSNKYYSLGVYIFNV